MAKKTAKKKENPLASIQPYIDAANDAHEKRIEVLSHLDDDALNIVLALVGIQVSSATQLMADIQYVRFERAEVEKTTKKAATK